MKLISDDILIDSGQVTPTYDAAYPSFDGFDFWDPSAWTKGHPYPMYKKMREQAPVMWTGTDKPLFSGFWSVTRYDDIKEVELNHKVFSSQRGSINMIVPDRKQWKPEKLVPAAYNSLINLDAPLPLGNASPAE